MCAVKTTVDVWVAVHGPKGLFLFLLLLLLLFLLLLSLSTCSGPCESAFFRREGPAAEGAGKGSTASDVSFTALGEPIFGGRPATHTARIVLRVGELFYSSPDVSRYFSRTSTGGIF